MHEPDHKPNPICTALPAAYLLKGKRTLRGVAAVLVQRGCTDLRTGRVFEPPALSKSVAARQQRDQRETQRRLRIVLKVLQHGLTLREAACLFGTNPASLCRWMDRYKRNGAQGLVPRYSPGRRPVRFDVPEETLREIAILAGACGNVRHAWRYFAPTLSPELRRRLRRWPLPSHLMRMTTPRRLPVQAVITAHGDLVVLVPKTPVRLCKALQRPKS